MESFKESAHLPFTLAEVYHWFRFTTSLTTKYPNNSMPIIIINKAFWITIFINKSKKYLKLLSLYLIIEYVVEGLNWLI